MSYQIKKAFQGIPELCVLHKGNLVALNNAFVKETPSDKSGPATKKTVPLVTQTQLKELFETGNPCVEQIVEVESKTRKQNSGPVDPANEIE